MPREYTLCKNPSKHDDYVLSIDLKSEVVFVYYIRTEKGHVSKVPLPDCTDFKSMLKSVLTRLTTDTVGDLKLIVFVGELSSEEKLWCELVSADYSSEKVFFVDTITATLSSRFLTVNINIPDGCDVLTMVDNHTSVTGTVWRQAGPVLLRYKELTINAENGKKFTTADINKLKDDLVEYFQIWIIETRSNHDLLQECHDMRLLEIFNADSSKLRYVPFLYPAQDYNYLRGALCVTGKFSGVFRNRGVTSEFTTLEKLQPNPEESCGLGCTIF